MTRYVPFVEGVTVSGTTVTIIAEAVQTFSVLRQWLLETLGVAAVDPERWYPQADILRTYDKVESLLGGRGLARLGKLVPAKAILPPGIHDAHSVLALLDATYHLNHRLDGVGMFDPATGAMLEGIGHYHYQGQAGARTAVMICDNPYPCRFDMGLFEGFVARFESTVTVTHAPEGCRAHGDPRCTYQASW